MYYEVFVILELVGHLGDFFSIITVDSILFKVCSMAYLWKASVASWLNIDNYMQA